MPKVSIYLSDDLYREARARNLPLSALAQQAVERAIEASRSEDWVARVRARKPRHHGPVDVPALLGKVREDFGG